MIKYAASLISFNPYLCVAPLLHSYIQRWRAFFVWVSHVAMLYFAGRANTSKGSYCAHHWPGYVGFLSMKLCCNSGLNISRYQSRSVAAHYLTIGYIILITTIPTIPVLPQARYLQNLPVASVWT